MRVLRRRLCALGKDERGNVLIIAALSLPVWLAGLGLGFEMASWYQLKRQMQNAADSAVVAASTNGVGVLPASVMSTPEVIAGS